MINNIAANNSDRNENKLLSFISLDGFAIILVIMNMYLKQ